MLTTFMHDHFMPGDGFFNSIWPILIAACVGVFFGMRHYFRGAQCPRIDNISGKVAIITGASSGIGLELTKTLATAGVKVIMACRDVKKAEKIISELAVTNPNSQVKFLELNLESFASVKKFVSDFKLVESRLDILINNGGIMCHPESITGDGHEIHYQVNYLSHFLLTQLLSDVLLATPGSRVINNTAHAYKLAEFTTEGLINADTSDVNANSNHLHCNGISSDVRDVESLTSGTLDDVDVEDVRNAQEAGVLLGEFSQTKNNLSVTSGVAYAQSKLALILFTRKLASKFGNATTVFVANPGVVRTNLYKNMPFKRNPILAFMLAPFLWFFMKSSIDGAQCALYCSTAQNLKSGEYYCECGASRLEANALGEKEMELLWTLSLKACNIQ